VGLEHALWSLESFRADLDDATVGKLTEYGHKERRYEKAVCCYETLSVHCVTSCAAYRVALHKDGGFVGQLKIEIHVITT
jgi:hypothetical protein